MYKLQIWNTNRVKLSDDSPNVYKGKNYSEADFLSGAKIANNVFIFKLYIKNLYKKKIKKIHIYYMPIDIDGNVLADLKDSREFCLTHKIGQETTDLITLQYKYQKNKYDSEQIKHINQVYQQWKKYKIVDLKITKVYVEYCGGSKMIDASEILFQEPNNGDSQFFQNMNENKEKDEKRQKRSDFIFGKIVPYVIAAIILLIMFAFAARGRKESEWSKLSEEEKQTIRDNMEFYDAVKDAADK